MSKKDRIEDDGIVVLRKPDENACGGTTATQDTRAPKKIESRDMILFSVTSVLPFRMDRENVPVKPEPVYVSAFAARDGDGTFVFLETGDGFSANGPRNHLWAYIKEDLMPALADLTVELDLVKNNGFHSRTHGLPENFGGDIDIRYASGESISTSDNQSPIISFDAGMRILSVFRKAMEGERVPLPDVSDLSSVTFSENRVSGGYTTAVLVLNGSGEAVNMKTSRYDDPRVYNSEKKVSAETVASIRKNIEDTGFMAWASLPENSFKIGHEKYIILNFSTGEQITVKGDRIVPDRIHGGFFNIELEMVTRN